MSSMSVGIDSELISQSSDSDPEEIIFSQVKSKRTTNSFGSWNFHYTLKTDLLGEQGVSTDEKKNLLTEHLRTRLGHHLPHAIHNVTVFCNFEMVMHHLPCACPLISVPIVGYVQSKSRAVHTMTQWFPDATWAPVPGGLADHPDFLRYMSLVENIAGPWFKLSVFGELGLNNAGRRAARENRKVFRKPLHPLPHPAV